jgi:hypothetical protein
MRDAKHLTSSLASLNKEYQIVGQLPLWFHILPSKEISLSSLLVLKSLQLSLSVLLDSTSLTHAYATFHKSFGNPPCFYQGELVEKIGRSPQAMHQGWRWWLDFESETDFTGIFLIFRVGWCGLVRLTLAFTPA